MQRAKEDPFSAEENVKKDVGMQYFSRKLYVRGIVTTGGAEEGFIFTDVDMLNELIGDTFRGDVVECSVMADAEGLGTLSSAIEAELPNVQPRAVRRLTQSQDIVLGKLQALVYLVTIVVLLITMISVYTTMMAMVAERKREIGLKKALGAENGLIMGEFLGELPDMGMYFARGKIDRVLADFQYANLMMGLAHGRRRPRRLDGSGRTGRLDRDICLLRCRIPNLLMP